MINEYGCKGTHPPIFKSRNCWTYYPAVMETWKPLCNRFLLLSNKGAQTQQFAVHHFIISCFLQVRSPGTTCLDLCSARVSPRAGCSFGDQHSLPSSRVTGSTHFLMVVGLRIPFLAGCQPGYSQHLEVTHFSCLVALSISKTSKGETLPSSPLLMLILTPQVRFKGLN